MAPKQPSPPALIKQVASLEASLLADLSDPNHLLPLLALARHASPQVVHKAIWALHRIFIPLLSSGRFAGLTSISLEPRGDEAEVDGSEAGTAREVKRWIRERLKEYLEILSGLLRDSEAALSSSALPLLFSLLPPLCTTGIHTIYFRILLDALNFPTASLRGASSRTASASASSSSASSRWIIVPAHQVHDASGVLPADVITLVVDDFWAKYDDLRLLFFRETRHLLESSSEPLPHPCNLLGQLMPLNNLPRKQADLNAFYIPVASNSPPIAEGSNKKAKPNPGKKGKTAKEVESTPDWMAAYDSDSESDDDTATGGKRPRERVSKLNVLAAIHSPAAHTAAYTDLYIAVLARVPLDEGWTRKILLGLHGTSGILSYMRADKRVRIADWLGTLVDRGGVEGMLAINGLFVLMTQYNLDYPNFYPRLYSLLTPSLLHTRHRARFFRLLDTFLRSALLPSALIASFIKRLSRLALTAPPGGIILVLPFVYGLFKRHVGCMGMLQRYDEGGWEGKSPQSLMRSPADRVDPYNPDDPSPFTSKAIDSSLWELASMQAHYLASISTMSGIFKEQFTKPEFALEDFLDHGYATLFETEIQRKIKYAPALSLALEIDDKYRPALFETGPKLASNGDAHAEEGVERADGDIVTQLWAF